MPEATPSQPRQAVVFGEALIDVFPEQRVVAGAPLHVATHLAYAGWDVAFVTRLGQDPEAERITAILMSYGVRTDFVETDPELPTGQVTVHLEDAATHSFTIHSPAAWDRIAGPERLPPHAVLYYGSLAARNPESRATLARLLERSSAPQKVFDVNLRPPYVEAETLRAGLAAATLLKVNAEEFTEVPRLLDAGSGHTAYFELAPALQLLCVTRGAEAIDLYDREGRRWSATPPDVDVADTVGAGDAFLAGLVAGLADGDEPADALQRGLQVAAGVLRQRGGLPTQV